MPSTLSKLCLDVGVNHIVKNKENVKLIAETYNIQPSELNTKIKI